jgi:hypothetical protein
MPRRLIALNLLLVAVSAALLVYIVRQVAAPMPVPVGGRRAAASASAPAPEETQRLPASAYGVVAARNLFSPTRTEAPAGTTTAALSPLVRPNLFGVVVRDGGSIAYLEDPATKRVVGYRVGDKIVGGTVQTIRADSVVIERPEGPVDVRLHDPGKPRAAASLPGQPGVPPLSAPQPGVAQPVPVAPPLPGVIPPAASPAQQPPSQMAQPPLQQQIPGQPPSIAPPSVQPPSILPPGVRRPLPPNLLRRVPPGMADAPQQ